MTKYRLVLNSGIHTNYRSSGKRIKREASKAGQVVEIEAETMNQSEEGIMFSTTHPRVGWTGTYYPLSAILSVDEINK